MRRRFPLTVALALLASSPPALAADGAGAGAEVLPPGTFTAETLSGAGVYGPDGRRIGEVGDVVIDPAGAIEGAIVVSGGFLGLGARRVAVPLDSLSIERLREGGEVRVVSRLTASEIAALPEYP